MSLCLEIRGKANQGNGKVSVCYRPPSQEEEVDEGFFKQLEEAFCSQVLVLMGDFYHLIPPREAIWQGPKN